MRGHRLRNNIVSALIASMIAIPIIVLAEESNEVPEAVAFEYIDTDCTEALPVGGAMRLLKGPTEDIIPEEIKDRVSLGDFTITAYCPCEICCPGTSDGLTYTETVATEGRTIAVDPGVIPLGSTVEIDGRSYIAEDIGGAVRGNRIDIFFNYHSDALTFGKQNFAVYMIEEAIE